MAFKRSGVRIPSAPQDRRQAATPMDGARLRADHWSSGRSSVVEHLLPKQRVVSSSLIARSTVQSDIAGGSTPPVAHTSGRSAVRLARLTGGQEVGGSNPLAPT